MATYNGAQFLREQIDSILNQSIQDFELVACDDCSSDGTFQIMEEYARKDSRVRIFKNEKNLGFKKNFEFPWMNIIVNYRNNTIVLR